MKYADRAVMHISKPVYAKLNALKQQQQQQLKRQVTFSEVIEQLLEKAKAA